MIGQVVALGIGAKILLSVVVLIAYALIIALFTMK